MPAATAPRRDVYTVSRLNREARLLLERGLPLLWVEGEISNLARPASGHWYFTLKDAGAQVRCAMFRNRNQLLRFQPRDGSQVLVRGRVSVYEARGDYQLVVEHMAPAGDGALRLAFEQLKEKLAAEGLFEPERKRPIPVPPRRLGVVTSAAGAALHDVLTVLARRFPAIPVLVYPVPVQGEGAAERIAAMIALAGRRAECDVLLVTRGGGSLEDLWAFNEEPVARAIAASPLPVVSAVGHEVDVTIADLVADRRAPTPSAAAELLSPDGAEWRAALGARATRLAQLARQGVRARRERLAWLAGRLQRAHPGARLAQRSQRVDELTQRLGAALSARLRARRDRLAALEARLHRHSPAPRLETLRGHWADLRRRLHRAMTQDQDRRRQRLEALGRALDTVSPLRTLERGYAIVTDADGRVLRRAADTAPGAAVQARLGRGRLHCRVDRVETGEEPES